ncbi:MAG: hypothetical protein GY725_02920 [bacterium]|nr:hypothetical protein [bacterium]
MASESSNETTCGERNPELGMIAQNISERLFPSPETRQEALGAVFLACEEIARDASEEYRDALRSNALESFLTSRVRERIETDGAERISGGWLGTFMEGDGRMIESESADTTDRAALELCNRALQRAVSIAESEGNSTLLRNLRWYRERLTHKSYEAIARSESRVAATVRTGVARARKFILRVIHELQNAQPAPLTGEAPGEIEPLRLLWVDQDLERLAAELDRTRGAHGRDPHWLNLAGLLAADRGDSEEATRHYELGLIYADAPSVRCRLLNNLGNLQEEGDVEAASAFWRRSHQLLPEAPAPLMNLISAASQNRDYASAQHYLSELGALLSAPALSEDERAYVFRRLEDNPKLGWLRDTDAWHCGPTRWLKSAAQDPTRKFSPKLKRRLIEAATTTLLALALLVPGIAGAKAEPAEHQVIERVAFHASPAGTSLAKSGPGGDSMGKPPRRAPQQLLAGDSMGRSGSPRPGGGKKRRG